jgi:hypothetical protein
VILPASTQNFTLFYSQKEEEEEEEENICCCCARMGSKSTTTASKKASGKEEKKSKKKKEETAKEKKKTKKSTTIDIDDIFGKVVKKKKTSNNERGADGKKSNSRNGKKEKEGYVKILLPGQKKPKGKRLNSKGEEVPEFTPVDKPRRIEDGLPVYKSYDDFTDMKHGQQKVDSKGRVLGPNGEPGGKCPFDCWCCF